MPYRRPAYLIPELPRTEKLAANGRHKLCVDASSFACRLDFPSAQSPNFNRHFCEPFLAQNSFAKVVSVRVRAPFVFRSPRRAN